MIVELMASVTAEVIPGTSLRSRPRFFLAIGCVIVGPYHSDAEWSKAALASHGSIDPNDMGHDEVLFDGRDQVLQGLRLGYSEVVTPAPTWPATWGQTPLTPGTLRLIAPSYFRLDERPIRWITPDGDALACIYEAAFDDLASSESLLRLRVAPNLDLVFARRRFCGWWLAHPARYLVDSWAEPYPEDHDGDLTKLFHDYMLLVDAAHVDRMIWKQDQTVLRELTALHTRLALPFSSARRQVVRNYIAEIVDKFYDQPRMEP